MLRRGTPCTTYNPASWWATFRWNLIHDGGGFYGAASAVSAANPIVTGIIALMLDADPTLDAIEVRDILQATARADAFTGACRTQGGASGRLMRTEQCRK